MSPPRKSRSEGLRVNKGTARSIKDTRPQRQSRARSDTRFHLLEEKANAYVII